MIDAEEYIRRKNENTREMLRQNSIQSFDITKFHGIDAVKGSVRPIKLIKKSHDIYAAIILGFLPYLIEHTGADAVKLSNNEFEDVELKTCYAHISPSRAFKTKKGTIYFTKDVSLWDEWVDQNKTSVAESHFNAVFNVRYNLSSKNRPTYLICVDADSGEIICIYELDGNTVVEYLKTSKDIKLGTFISRGRAVMDSMMPLTGWLAWCDRVSANLLVKRTSTIEREKDRLIRAETDQPVSTSLQIE